MTLASLRGLARAAWRPALVVAVAALLGWWLFGLGPLYESRYEEAPSPAAVTSTPVEPSWQPRPRPHEPEPGCTPRADAICLQGDPWWVDSCGEPHERAEDCGLRACVDGACEADDPSCLEQPMAWQCDGDIARGCVAGQRYAIDCGAQDERCVMTDDGPACRERTPEDCDEIGVTRCEGSELVACIAGRWERFDCSTVAGQCMPGRGGRGFRCVRFAEPDPDEACGACGCPPGAGEEVCDGRDNDGDNFVDEGVECGVVDIVAFVIVDEDGQGAFTDEDIEAEVERINRAFARDDELGISFRLADIVAWGREEWLELDAQETQEILLGATWMPREAFYVPIVFTQSLMVDDVPRPGVATPPNGMCGGQRRVRELQPILGGVILAKRRWPTTAAHEVGHFLGLCHTHMPDADAVEVYGASGRGDALACFEPCDVEGDGVCDTPSDPGPERCAIDPECLTDCPGGERPDASNIMAYYPECRAIFTQEQARLMRTSLALRRGWHACLSEEGCACTPGAAVGQAGSCPEAMSCRRFASDEGEVHWSCGLDGPVMPGGPCDSPAQCAEGSTCVQPVSGPARCVRPCAPLTATCDCATLPGIEVPLCLDDLE